MSFQVEIGVRSAFKFCGQEQPAGIPVNCRRIQIIRGNKKGDLGERKVALFLVSFPAGMVAESGAIVELIVVECSGLYFHQFNTT